MLDLSLIKWNFVSSIKSFVDEMLNDLRIIKIGRGSGPVVFFENEPSANAVRNYAKVDIRH